MAIAMLLLEREATVTVTHIETKGLPDIARKADIIVAAAGVPRLVKGAPLGWSVVRKMRHGSSTSRKISRPIAHCSALTKF